MSRRRWSRNADEGLRRRERERAVAGDAESVIAYDRSLWRSGQAIPYYAEELLGDFIEDLRAFRSYTRLSHQHAEPVLLDIRAEPTEWDNDSRLIASPGPSDEEGHGAQVRIPDRFGRLHGLMLSMQVTNSRMRWSSASRTSIQDVARIEKAGGTASQHTVVRVCVALIQPKDPFNSPVNPLYFFHKNNERWFHHTGARTGVALVERRLPARMFCANLLTSDLDTHASALEAIERALAEAFEAMNVRLGFVDQILDRTARYGPKSWSSRSFHDLKSVIEEMQAVAGPVIGRNAPGPAKPTIRAWNVSGGGILEAVMLCLGEWLVRNYRAVIQGVQVDPYDSELAWFKRSHMSVTSRRARQTAHPVRFEVDWDGINGVWADRGDAWIGNENPSGGTWRISMVDSPATAAELVGPSVEWIKAVFPGAKILVAAQYEPGAWGHPDYRTL